MIGFSHLREDVVGHRRHEVRAQVEKSEVARAGERFQADRRLHVGVHELEQLEVVEQVKALQGGQREEGS